MTNLKMTVTENGSVIFDESEEAFQPVYKWWSGQITQAGTEGITCIPHNMNDADYLGFIGEESLPSVGNGISFIPRSKAGYYLVLLPYAKKDIYFSHEYFKKINQDEIFFSLADMGDGTTLLEINSIIDGIETDGVIVYMNFEIKVRQHYEVN